MSSPMRWGPVHSCACGAEVQVARSDRFAGGFRTYDVQAGGLHRCRIVAQAERQLDVGRLARLVEARVLGRLTVSRAGGRTEGPPKTPNVAEVPRRGGLRL